MFPVLHATYLTAQKCYLNGATPATPTEVEILYFRMDLIAGERSATPAIGGNHEKTRKEAEQPKQTSTTGTKETTMKPTQAGSSAGQAIPAPTATVKVSDKDELGVWVVGEGTPVILVHGALIWSLLKPLAEELAKRGDYQVIWYHRCGYNGNPTEPADVAGQARDTVKIMDELDIEKAHVVGHSAGANYALELATLAQDRLLSVALLDFVLVEHVESRAMFLEAMKPSIAKAQAGDFEGAGADFLSAMGATEDLLKRYLPRSWSAMAQDAPTWFQVDLPALAEWRLDPANVKVIEIPIAFISVTGLPPFRETGEVLQTWQPKLTLLEFSTDNHFFPVTATVETAAVIDNWIKNQGTTS